MVELERASADAKAAANSSALEGKGNGDGPGAYADASSIRTEGASDSAFAEASGNEQLAFTDPPLGNGCSENISAGLDWGLEWLDEEDEPINNNNDGGAGNVSRMVGAVLESGDVDMAVAGALELGSFTVAAFFPIVLENAPNGTFVLVAGGVSRLPVEYSLTDDADGRFDIDPLTGLITVEDGSKIDYEASVAHDVEVVTTLP